MKIANQPVRCKVLEETSPQRVALFPGAPPVLFRPRIGMLDDLHWIVRKPAIPFKKVQDWDGSVVTVPDESKPQYRVQLLRYETWQAAYLLYAATIEDPDLEFQATPSAFGLMVPPDRAGIPTDEQYRQGQEWLDALVAEFEEAGLHGDVLRMLTAQLRDQLSLDPKKLEHAKKKWQATPADVSSSTPTASSDPKTSSGVHGIDSAKKNSMSGSDTCSNAPTLPNDGGVA